MDTVMFLISRGLRMKPVADIVSMNYPQRSKHILAVVFEPVLDAQLSLMAITIPILLQLARTSKVC